MATFELDRLAVEDAKTAILRPLDKGAILVDESTGTEYKAKDNISQTGMSITKMLTDGLLVGAGSGGGGGVGLPGPAGPAGQDGVDGKDGAVGPHGPQGPAGTAGTNGTDGAKGPKGDDGAKGADGATGAAGPKGPKGDTGPRGPAGSGGGTGGGLDPVDQAKIDHITITTDINLDDLDEADIYKTRKNINEQDLTKPVVTDPGTYFIQNQNELAIVVPNNIAGAVPTKAVFAINEKGELRTGRTKGSTMVWGPAAGVGPAGPAGAIGPKGPKGDTGAAGPHGAQGPAGVAGPKGDAGDDGSGLFQFDYKVKVGTVDATPSKGYVAFDNVDPSKATKMYFNVKDRRSADMTLFLSAISAGDYINLHDNGDINDFVAFDSIGKGVLAGSVVTVPVSNYSHAGTLRNNERVYIHWERMQDISGLLKSDGSVAMDTGYKPMFSEDVTNKQYVDDMNIGSTFTTPKVLTPATDLDTFKTEGYYENKSKTDLGTVALHYPEDGSLGILKVFADTNLSNKVYQEFMDIKDARFYTRAFDGSTWQQWVLRDLSALKPNDVATVADIDAPKPTAEQLGKIMNLYGTKHLVDKSPAHLHGTTVPADTLGKDGDIYFKIK